MQSTSVNRTSHNRKHWITGHICPVIEYNKSPDKYYHPKTQQVLFLNGLVFGCLVKTFLNHMFSTARLVDYLNDHWIGISNFHIGIVLQ